MKPPLADFACFGASTDGAEGGAPKENGAGAGFPPSAAGGAPKLNDSGFETDPIAAGAEDFPNWKLSFGASAEAGCGAALAAGAPKVKGLEEEASVPLEELKLNAGAAGAGEEAAGREKEKVAEGGATEDVGTCPIRANKGLVELAGAEASTGFPSMPFSVAGFPKKFCRKKP